MVLDCCRSDKPTIRCKDSANRVKYKIKKELFIFLFPRYSLSYQKRINFYPLMLKLRDFYFYQ